MWTPPVVFVQFIDPVLVTMMSTSHDEHMMNNDAHDEFMLICAANSAN